MLLATINHIFDLQALMDLVKADVSSNYPSPFTQAKWESNSMADTGLGPTG